MSASSVAAPTRGGRGPVRASARLLRIELRHNAMLWMIPVAAVLFWFTEYRKVMALPPLWNLRATGMQSGVVVAFACPVAGAAAWMGSRDGRHRIDDLVGIAARPLWSRLLAIWAASTCWALVAYAGCAAALYAATGGQATWGGPLWWPVAVAAATLPAVSALGFAAGALVRSRFTAPVAAVVVFFLVVLSTELIHGSTSYWVVSPIITGPWNIGSDPGIATFYPYLPDLSIVQLMFLTGLTVAVLGGVFLGLARGGRLRRSVAVLFACVTVVGLVAAGTAVRLAGTGRLDPHGMIAIPAVHDAADDRPVSYTPVCSRTAIPVCLNPAYASYLPAVVRAAGPVLAELAGLPGAPVRVSQVTTAYLPAPDDGVQFGQSGPAMSGTPPVFRMILPSQLPGPSMSANDLTGAMRTTIVPDIVTAVTGGGGRSAPSNQAQQAVAGALLTEVGLQMPGPMIQVGRDMVPQPLPVAVRAAGHRFGALPWHEQRAWLMKHLPALRAGQVTLAELP